MRNEVVVQKLIAYAQKVVDYCKAESYESFVKDTKLVEACVFNLSQMGELCRTVDESYAESHPQVPWKEMYGLRNRIVHDYEGVNMLLVWQIISEDLPNLCHILGEL